MIYVIIPLLMIWVIVTALMAVYTIIALSYTDKKDINIKTIIIEAIISIIIVLPLLLIF